MRQMAEWLYGHRHAALVLIILVTMFFVWEVRDLDISTHFRDLYPKTHPYLTLFEEYPEFCSPFTVYLTIQVKKGDIYNYKTLYKIQEATRLIDLIPGVNHNQVLSIAARKIKYTEVTVDGVKGTPLLAEVPNDPKEIAILRERVRSTAGVRGMLISHQEDAAIVQATFIDRLADYDLISSSVNDIIKGLRDDNHELYAVGQPILIGWVYHYQGEMRKIFGVGIIILILLLVVYSRSVAGVLTPILVGVVNGIWGFGFASLLGYNLDPLTIVVPILLVARGHSHAIQMCGRYVEVYQKVRDKKEACIASFAALFPPGAVGIICDASGLFIIAVAPISLIQKLALICGLWSASLIVTSVTLTFLINSYLPPPKGESVFTAEKDRGILQKIFKFLTIFSSSRRWAIGTILVFVGVSVVSVWFATHREIGDVHPGTPLLWPASVYNRASKAIGERFAGLDTLQIVVEAKEAKMEGRAEKAQAAIVGTSATLGLMEKFQRHMELDPEVGGTLSFADFPPRVYQVLSGGSPKWDLIPNKNNDVAAMSFLVLTSAGVAPGDFDYLLPAQSGAACIYTWYKDHRGKTVERAIKRAQEFIDGEKETQERLGVKLRPAIGTIGLIAANNSVIKWFEPITVVLITVVIFIVTSYIYRSFTAGLLLILISNMANFMCAAVMYLMDIGLDVNTLPVAAVGMGIGIDYNIYLMSRMCEEYRLNSDYAVLVPRSIMTTGKQIFFTSTSMIGGVIIWYFLSNLRFSADMGLLLSAVMFAHVVLALIFQPAVMRLIQPAFIKTGLARGV